MKKFRKVLLKQNIKKVILSILLVILLVVEFAFSKHLLTSLSSKKDDNTNNVLMHYTSKGSIPYNVVLKENEFIDNDELEDGSAYVASLIDHIDITPSYFFNSSKKTKATGKYKVTTSLVVDYKDSNSRDSSKLLNKEKVLGEKDIVIDGDSYSTSDIYSIYLDEYIEMYKSFQSEAKVSLDGYLQVDATATFEGEQSAIAYNNEYTSSIKIPLNSSIIKIESSDSTPKNGYVYKTDFVKSNKPVIIYIVTVIVALFAAICVLLRLLFVTTTKTNYEKTLSKFLKTYDDVIVDTNNMAKLSDYNIIEVKDFKEMLNLSRELLLPIINYEYKKDKETWFYIIKDKILYRFKLSAKDLGNTKTRKSLLKI